jgi:hypothetical protein
MKYKHIALIFAATIMTNAAQAAERIDAVGAHNEATQAAVATAAAADEGREFDMFRFSQRMEKIDFVRSAMALPADQEKKFMDIYYIYDIELKKLHNKRLEMIKDYAAKFENMTNADAANLSKRFFEFRKQRTALLEKYHAKVAKALTPVIAARFGQVESLSQATTDVKIGSSLPIMPKQ